MRLNSPPDELCICATSIYDVKRYTIHSNDVLNICALNRLKNEKPKSILTPSSFRFPLISQRTKRILTKTKRHMKTRATKTHIKIEFFITAISASKVEFID